MAARALGAAALLLPLPAETFGPTFSFEAVFGFEAVLGLAFFAPTFFDRAGRGDFAIFRALFREPPLDRVAIVLLKKRMRKARET